MKPIFTYSSDAVLKPNPNCPWAQTMVLNPAILRDPDSPTLHMLFRASGPWPQKRHAGQPLPYPIFLGYATSRDNGRTWEADFSRPALAPMLQDTPDAMVVLNTTGEKVVNYVNGLVEDPRFIQLEDRLYVSVAGRMFPPGPFWKLDQPMQCAPRWAIDGTHTLGRAATENLAVSVLYEVEFDKLRKRDYENAFKYVMHLTNPEWGDNRDVFLFPERLVIDGRRQYVCIHRPKETWHYSEGRPGDKPTIYICCAESLFDLPTAKSKHRVLARTTFDWEEERVGGSWTPIKISTDEWLLAYHGKKDDVVGYTQSFMILQQPKDGLPVVKHRCSDRLMYAQTPWQLPGSVKYNTRPCIFSCGGIVVDDDLIMSYGASDEKVGMAWVNFNALLAYVRTFDEKGNRIGM